MLSRQSLTRTSFLSSTIILFLLVTVLGYFWIREEYRNLSFASDSIRAQYMASQKELIRNEVSRTLNYIRFKQAQAEEQVREDLKERADEAYNIAAHLTALHRGKTDGPGLRKLVIESLRPMRYHDGRGYYFAFSLSGEADLNTEMPSLEGRKIMDLKDSNGKYLIRDMIGIIRDRGEGFHEYTWPKPGRNEPGFAKLACIKYFKPLDLVIGTGEYLDDVENDIKNEVLERIRLIQFGNDGYVFVMDKGGTFLSHPQKELIGRKIREFKEPKYREIFSALMQAGTYPAGGYVMYRWMKPSLGKEVHKLSYVQSFPEWGWILVTGVYLDDVEKAIASRFEQDRQTIENQILFICILVCSFIFISLFITRYFSTKIRKGIDMLTNFFRNTSTSYEKIDPSTFPFTEFRIIGEYANKMVDDFRAAQEELRSEKDRAQMYLDTAGVMFVALDTRGSVTLVNRKGCMILGLEEREIVGRNWVDSFSPERHREEARDVIQKLTSDSLEELEYREGTIVTRNNGERVIAWHNSVMRSEDGTITGLLCSGEDVTEKKKSEQEKALLKDQLTQAQKMESIGRLAGGVAHDFNNMLTVILGYAEMIKLKLSPEDPLMKGISAIEHAASRSKEMTRQLLAFSRKQIIDPRPMNMNTLIENMRGTIARLIGEDIDLHFNPGEGLWMIKGDPSQLEQVLVNLAVNARDAMPGVGRLVIETANTMLDESYCREHVEFTPGEYVMLTVSDDGEGMDGETRQHIFEPFFTTKKQGKGTGLGLATVYGIVRQNGGHISVFSEQGSGATFRIYIPRNTEEESAPGAAEPEAMARGTDTVLLVEDNEQVCGMTTEMLESLGYTVLVSGSPQEALSWCESNDTPVDLVVTDVIMPVMSGKELQERLLHIRPDLRFLFMSGYTSNVIGHHGILEEGVHFIQKPFTMNELAHKIRETVKGQ